MFQLNPSGRRGFGPGGEGIAVSDNYLDDRALGRYPSRVTRDRLGALSDGEPSPVKYFADAKGRSFNYSPRYNGQGIRIDVAVERNVDV